MKCLKLAKNAGALFAFAVAVLPLASAADGIIPVKMNTASVS